MPNFTRFFEDKIVRLAPLLYGIGNYQDLYFSVYRDSPMLSSEIQTAA